MELLRSLSSGNLSFINKTIHLFYHHESQGKVKDKEHLNSNPDCDLDRNPEDVPVFTEHSLFNTTKRITLFFIVHSRYLAQTTAI